MIAFLSCAAVALLGFVALGLLRLLIGPSRVDRMMAAQLAGTGCAAIALLLAVTGREAIIDVALVLVLLATMAVAALWRFDAPACDDEGGEDR
jgi:multicomponent Na+:H+ antiporter subunit F